MSSSRGMVRAMLVIGSTQSINILISILRVKILAILLGPAGIGLLGIFTNLQQTVIMFAGLGLGTSGVRQIAATRGDGNELARVRVVLLWANILQGLLALVLVWCFREQLAVWLMNDKTRADQIGLVGIGVLLSLIAASQTALLQGLRRIRDLGLVTVLGAVAGTAAGLAAVWLQGLDGLIWFILVQPLAAIMVALYFTHSIPRVQTTRFSTRDIWRIWRPMAALGGIFMLGGLATTATILLVRGKIVQDLGLGVAGQFSASWSITIQYVGFLLGAMAADYYPRLTEVINDREQSITLINDQAQIGLALGGPVLLLLIGLAPWVISLLYSAEFAPAAELLEWQSVGNIFKLASWPLGFVFIASARSWVFLGTELFWNGIFIATIWLGISTFGLLISGIGFLLAYIIYFALLNLIAYRIFAFRWQKLSLILIFGHATLALLLLLLARTAPFVGGISSIVLALITGIVGMRVIVTKTGTTGKISAKLARAFEIIGWPMKATDGDSDAPT